MPRFIISTVLLAALSFSSAFAVPAPEEFKLAKKNRILKLTECAMVEGFTTIGIRDGGRYLSLPGSAKREPKKLPKGFRRFACGLSDLDGLPSVFAMPKDSEEITEFRFALEDFKKISSNLGKVCKNIIPINGSLIYKSKNSPHTAEPIRSSFGFIGLPGSYYPTYSCIDVYDSAGKKQANLGVWAVGEPNYSFRSYAGFACAAPLSGAQLRAKAVKNTKKPDVYIRLFGNACIHIPDAGDCYNSIQC